ncbi:hypothetical protein RJ640_025497 [Escallonia rubra]|uniref:Retrovirus-related Pol polyprotein from transposon TNT 1-94-like beta-barrel domain-containing protein n=1 Tax=Escallonia rubra TaxID=112253 RepID=A0AA88R161_9ASTE|nr:hypothetical protein RJ640_025497 [Escallonia rubra]
MSALVDSSRVNGTSSSSQGEGLVVRSENKSGHGRGRYRSRSRNLGHGKDRFKSRGKQDNSSIECWYSKEIGHIARKCLENKEKKNGKKHMNNANVAEEDDKSNDGDLYLVSSVEQQEGNLLSVREYNFSMEWFLDSACSFHMCPYKERFDCLTPCNDGNVLMGNDDACKVMGICTIKMKMFDGIVRTLGDVRYIPDLKKNLISLGTLDSIDFSISIKGEVMKVSKCAMVIMKGQETENLYKPIWNTIISGASVSTTHAGSSNDNSELWHKWLGHLNEGVDESARPAKRLATEIGVSAAPSAISEEDKEAFVAPIDQRDAPLTTPVGTITTKPKATRRKGIVRKTRFSARTMSLKESVSKDDDPSNDNASFDAPVDEPIDIEAISAGVHSVAVVHQSMSSSKQEKHLVSLQISKDIEEIMAEKKELEMKMIALNKKEQGIWGYPCARLLGGSKCRKNFRKQSVPIIRGIFNSHFHDVLDRLIVISAWPFAYA